MRGHAVQAVGPQELNVGTTLRTTKQQQNALGPYDIVAGPRQTLMPASNETQTQASSQHSGTAVMRPQRHSAGMLLDHHQHNDVVTMMWHRQQTVEAHIRTEA